MANFDCQLDWIKKCLEVPGEVSVRTFPERFDQGGKTHTECGGTIVCDGVPC